MEGLNKSKYLEDKFHDVCYHGLCSTIKDFPEAKAKHCTYSLNECLLQLKRHKPQFSETKESNKEEKDK